MNRRILLIATFVIGVLALGTVLFVVFFRGEEPTPNANTNENTNAVLPNLNGNVNRQVGNANAVLPNVNGRNVNGGAAGNVNAAPGTVANGGDTQVQTLVSANAMATMVDANGNVRYYDKTTGQFYRLDANGNLVLLTQAKFLGASDIVWSPAGDQAVLAFPDGSKISYNFETKKQATLPREGQDFSFSPTGSQLAFKYNASDPDDRYLVIANPDGTSIRRRRECFKCNYRFSTLEETEILDLTVIKRDGRRESYNREKIIQGLHKALEKRPYTSESFQFLLHAIEKDIQKRRKREIKSSEIGEIVMNRLKGFDKVAYIRFASVYRSFEDVKTFKKELEGLSAKSKKLKVKSKK